MRIQLGEALRACGGHLIRRRVVWDGQPCVSAGSRPWLKMHLQSEKVTSTCSQRFAELDPHCPSMLGGACESFKAAADACRLSLEVLRRLSSKLGALCRQSLRGTPTIKPMVLKVQT